MWQTGQRTWDRQELRKQEVRYDRNASSPVAVCVNFSSHIYIYVYIEHTENDRRLTVILALSFLKKIMIKWT